MKKSDKSYYDAKSRGLLWTHCEICKEFYGEHPATAYYKLPCVCESCNVVKDTPLFKILEKETHEPTK